MKAQQSERQAEVAGSPLIWSLHDGLEAFDWNGKEVHPGSWQGSEALELKGMNAVTLLRQPIEWPSFRLQAEVAIPGPVSFVGLVFGARDSWNYELIYLAPEEIQYDPIMNGSMTWQIYNGPQYQKPVPSTTGQWHRLIIDVHPEGALVYLNDLEEPQLVISRLQHGGGSGRIGFWNYLPAYIRNLSVEPISSVDKGVLSTSETKLLGVDGRSSEEAGLISEWLVSEPYMSSEKPSGEENWTKVDVEGNGVLNLNRLYPAEQGAAVTVRSSFLLAGEREARISFGFSDHLRLWVNEELVFEGSWTWNPPVSDGRIRGNYEVRTVSLKKGLNRIRAEVTHQESFGWGLRVQVDGAKHVLANE